MIRCASPTVLLTGAAGYIGSHAWVALDQAGYRVVGVDDLSNSSMDVLNRVERLTGRALVFERADVGDATAMADAVRRHRPEAAIHLAAFRVIAESTRQPMRYYRNNLACVWTLCKALQDIGCKRLVFSSSATVYGQIGRLPITEDAPLWAASPYAATKVMGERLLQDLAAADPQWRTVALRYFNPAGAHESGLIGEDPRATPSTLLPYVAQVAAGRRDRLQVFGHDYDTRDGTGVRDYTHVVDIAEGHVAALAYLLHGGCRSIAVNLGTGQGHSVLEVVAAFEKASGRKVPYCLAPRRIGDVAAAVADPALAEAVLGWRAKHGLRRICTDSWRWQQLNDEPPVP
jgi:UDP-glucose 4-epimerase